MLKHFKINKELNNTSEDQPAAKVIAFDSNEELLKYFEHKQNLSEQEWDAMIDQMAPNVDFTLFCKAIYSNNFKYHKKSFQIDIHNDELVMGIVNRNDKKYDAAIQIWHKYKSVVIGVRLNKYCDKRWNDEHVELCDWAKVLTSFLLNAYESGEHCNVQKGIVYELGRIDPRVQNSGIFEVLD